MLQYAGYLYCISILHHVGFCPVLYMYYNTCTVVLTKYPKDSVLGNIFINCEMVKSSSFLDVIASFVEKTGMLKIRRKKISV